VWRYTNHSLIRQVLNLKSIRRENIFGLVESGGILFAASDSYGIAIYNRDQWQEVQFADSSLNMTTLGIAITYRGTPCFGTMDGSIVFYRDHLWNRIPLGEGPVTFLASDGKSLFAWTDGQLVAITF